MKNKYFTEETDHYINQYLETDDIKVQHEIFNKNIRPIFEQLIENLIRTYSFYNIDELEWIKNDCLSNLYEQLPKFKRSKVLKTSRRTGSPGFAYFNVVAKHWFFQKSRELSKRYKLEEDLHVEIDNEYSSNEEFFVEDYDEKQQEMSEFWQDFVNSLDSWRPHLTKKTEKKVLEGVIFLMKHPELVPIYNKKAIYMFLREITNLNGKQIVVNLKKFRMLYLDWKKEYYRTKSEDE